MAAPDRCLSRQNTTELPEEYLDVGFPLLRFQWPPAADVYFQSINVRLLLQNKLVRMPPQKMAQMHRILEDQSRCVVCFLSRVVLQQASLTVRERLCAVQVHHFCR